jgi:FHA domain-containing protein
MAKLLINSGPNRGAQIDLIPGSNRLGRALDNDIQIEEPSVSSHHCEILLENGTITVRDLGSTNGTFIDGRQIQEAPIEPGQKLQLGSLEMSYESAVRVRVSASPQPHTAPAPALPAGMSPCKNHAMNPAEWLCNHCHHLYCNACVLLKTIRSKQVQCCAMCGSQCIRFGLGVFAKQQEKRSFFSQLPEVFTYPLRGNGLILLIGGTIFFGVLALLQRAPAIGLFIGAMKLLLGVISGGYMFSYLQKIIHSSAQGDDEMPAWPDFTNYWDDIIRPYLQAVALVLICFGPAWFVGGKALFEFALGGEVQVVTILAFAALSLIGLAYLPMALLAVAMADSIAGVNPLFVIPSILKVPLEYLVVCCVMAAALITQTICAALLERFIPLPVLPALLSGFVFLYFLTAEMRLLGVMYYANKDRLNWF